MRAYGLQTHIWNNNVKSVLLMAGFPIVLALLLLGLVVGYVGLAFAPTTNEEAIALILAQYKQVWPFAFLAALIWFGIAFAFHQSMIKAAIGSKGLDRKDNPRIYNLHENLCIACGMRPPKLDIVETNQLNAFASGIDESSYTVTLTRGLINTLEDAELEAVIAHELTHIRNRDVRLLIVSVIFVGIIAFVGEIIFRNMFRAGLYSSGHSRSRKGDSRGGGLLIIAAIAIIAIAYFLAVLIRFALSRKREYLADAGAVDLTRNPDAMASALQKISGRSAIEQAPDDIKQMMVDNAQPFLGMFTTHPPIEKRVEALREYAGAL
ncbi:MAG: M48 family metallopeptidase [Pseudomonadota bacterium]